MKSQIETLKREIQIHKEVEKELAKRSHFCQKVIKRLRAENAELKSDQQDRPSTQPNFSKSKTPRNAGLAAPDAHKAAMQEELKSSEELISFLEGKLEQHEKNFQ